MNRLTLLLILLTIIACSPQVQRLQFRTHSQDTIINGTEIPADSLILKSSVNIGLPFNKNCSGILLTDRIVLTAAHCVNYGALPSQLSVVIPSASKSCFSAKVSEYALAPKLSDELHTSPDIALLKLDRAVCAPAPAVLSLIPKRRLLTATGFGQGNFGVINVSMKLQLISSDLQTLRSFYQNEMSNPNVANDWNLVEQNYPTFSEQYLFAVAKSSQQSLCFGDSGGPVYIEEKGQIKILGVVGGGLPHATKGVSACQNTYLQVFAPIGPSRAWIQSQVQLWNN